MKYKVGDKVKVKKGLVPHNTYGGIYFNEEMKKLEGKILTIRSIEANWGSLNYYRMREMGCSWSEEMLEDINIEAGDIEAGDKVRIRMNCTIGDLAANKWNLALGDTVNFFAQYGKDVQKVFTVKKVSEKGNIVIQDMYGKDLYVNYNALELVEKKVVKEMTVKEISEMLGYEVKIVKD